MRDQGAAESALARAPNLVAYGKSLRPMITNMGLSLIAVVGGSGVRIATSDVAPELLAAILRAIADIKGDGKAGVSGFWVDTSLKGVALSRIRRSDGGEGEATAPVYLVFVRAISLTFLPGRSAQIDGNLGNEQQRQRISKFLNLHLVPNRAEDGLTLSTFEVDPAVWTAMGRS